MMREELYLANLLSEDVEITAAHVANLQSLLTNLSAGNFNLGPAMAEEVTYIQNTSTLRGAAVTGLPATANGTYDLTVSGGKYVDKYIENGNYNESYAFDLTNTTHNKYYTDDRYDGALSASGTLPVVTFSISDSYSVSQYFGKVTFSATLSAASDYPVSFEYRLLGLISSAQLYQNDKYSDIMSTPGTLTWEAGESGTKESTVYVDLYAYMGTASVVFDAFDIKNATFAEGKTTWTQTFTVTSTSNALYELYQDSYYESVVYSKGGSELTEKGWDGVIYSYNQYVYYGNVDWFDKSASAYQIYLEITDDSNNPPSTLREVYVYVYSPAAEAQTNNYMELVKSTNMQSENGKVRMTFPYSSGVDLTERIDDSGKIGFRVRIATEGKTVTPSLNNITIRYFNIFENVTATSVTATAGVYQTGEVMPINVTFDHPVVADKNTKLKINGNWYPLLAMDDTYLE